MLLVTGGKGFVATHLACALRAAGLPFTLAARHSEVDVIGVGSLDSRTDWTEALSGTAAVVHLAGVAHKPAGEVSLDHYREINVNGTANLAMQAAAAGARRFVFVSSIGVLGQKTSPGNPLTDFSPLNPQTPYAISKCEAEDALKAICPKLGMELVILRPPLIYGPEAPGNFRRLINLVKLGQPLPLKSVRNRRSMISVESFVNALIASATTPEAANETFALADSHAISTPETIMAIARGLRKRYHLFPFPPTLLKLALRSIGRNAVADGLLSSLEVDSTRIREKLTWAPEPCTTDAIESQLIAIPKSSTGNACSSR